MRGIDVDKGLNTLENGCAERGAFLRRNMVRIRRKKSSVSLQRRSWSIMELRAVFGFEMGSDLTISEFGYHYECSYLH